jgi:putative ABC transport system permease protein
MFIVVDGFVLKPLPFRDADQLFAVGLVQDRVIAGWAPRRQLGGVTRAELDEILHVPGVISAMGYTTKVFVKQEYRDTEGLVDAGVTPSFFEGLGVQPFIGRRLTNEDIGVVPRRALISFGIWTDRFGRDPGVVGQTIVLAGESLQVVGIMPPRFNFPGGANLWVVSQSRIRSLTGVIRVTLGKTPPQKFRLSSGNFLAVPLREFLEPEQGKVLPLTFLFLAAGVVLAITWLHLGALRAVHVFDRARETAVRMAMGASPWQIARKQLIENVFFVGIALIAAVLLLPTAVKVTVLLLPSTVTLGREIAVDHRAILFLGFATLMGIALMSLGPVRATMRTDVLALLKNEGQTLSSFSFRRGCRTILVAQVALVSSLLYSTGMLATELLRVRHLDLGFDPDGLLILKPAGANDSFGPSVQQATMLEQIRKVPGVLAAAAGFDPSFIGVMPVSVGIDANSSRSSDSSDSNAMYQGVSPGYFRTVRTPILEGRDFEYGEKRVVMVSQGLARAIGRPNGLAGSTVWVNGGPFLVAGIVGDIQANVTDEFGKRPYLYYQSPTLTNPILVRVDQKFRRRTIDRIISVVQGLTGQPDRPWILDARQRVEPFIAPHTSRVVLVGIQAGTALLLALVGLYSLAHQVLRQQLRSIAVRKALGAPNKHVMMLTSGLVVVNAAIGLSLGLGLGLAMGRWMSSAAIVASNAETIDVFAVALTVLSVLIASLLGLIAPVCQALRLDPSVLLRFE